MNRPDTSWRGKSRTDYPVAIRDLDTSTLRQAHGCICLGVARDGHGIGQIRDLVLADKAGSDWPDRARAEGCTELHIVAPASDQSPDAILDDLWPDHLDTRAAGKRKTRRAA